MIVSRRSPRALRAPSARRRRKRVRVLAEIERAVDGLRARYSQIACVMATMCASVNVPSSDVPRCPLVPNDDALFGDRGIGAAREVLALELRDVDQHVRRRGLAGARRHARSLQYEPPSFREYDSAISPLATSDRWAQSAATSAATSNGEGLQMRVGFVGLGRMGSRDGSSLARRSATISRCTTYSRHRRPRSPRPARRSLRQSPSSRRCSEIVVTMLVEDAVRSAQVGSRTAAGSANRCSKGVRSISSWAHTASPSFASRGPRIAPPVKRSSRHPCSAGPIRGDGPTRHRRRGPEEAVARCTVLLQGRWGGAFSSAGVKPESATAIKLANNAVLGCAMVAMAEGFALVRKYDAPPQVFQDVMTEGLFAGVKGTRCTARRWSTRATTRSARRSIVGSQGCEPHCRGCASRARADAEPQRLLRTGCSARWRMATAIEIKPFSHASKRALPGSSKGSTRRRARATSVSRARLSDLARRTAAGRRRAARRRAARGTAAAARPVLELFLRDLAVLVGVPTREDVVGITRRPVRARRQGLRPLRDLLLRQRAVLVLVEPVERRRSEAGRRLGQSVGTDQQRGCRTRARVVFSCCSPSRVMRYAREYTRAYPRERLPSWHLA